mgnify:CR=1 FL=1
MTSRQRDSRLTGSPAEVLPVPCHRPSLLKLKTGVRSGRFDAGIPMEGVEALIAKDHPTAQIFVYEAGHGFNSDRRKDYHEPSSEQARERTLMLFRACGG